MYSLANIPFASTAVVDLKMLCSKCYSPMEKKDLFIDHRGRYLCKDTWSCMEKSKENEREIQREKEKPVGCGICSCTEDVKFREFFGSVGDNGRFSKDFLTNRKYYLCERCSYRKDLEKCSFCSKYYYKSIMHKYSKTVGRGYYKKYMCVQCLVDEKSDKKD